MGKENLKARKRASNASQLVRFLHREGKKYCAIALSASLIAGNIGYIAAAADDGTSNDFEFELDRVSLYEALQEAVLTGNTVDTAFEFAGEEADTYASLLEADGSLYELVPEIEDNDGDVSLRVFARLDGDIALDSAYEIDGSEEMIFLLTNTSKAEKTAVVIVNEKVTDQITVAPKSAVEAAGEANPYHSAEASTAAPGVDGETEPGTENAIVIGGSSSGGGSGSGGGSSVKVEETESAQETVAAESVEPTEDAEVSDGTEADVTIDQNVNDSEEQETEVTEGSEVTVEGDEEPDADADSENAVEAAEEKTGGLSDDENDVQTGGGLEAAISYHKTYRVAAKATDSDATSSDAASSGMDKNVLDGMVYNAVLMEGISVTAFTATFDELDISDILALYASPSNAGRFYESDLGDVTVRVWAGNGVLPEDAELRVSKLSENDETADQFQEAKAALDASGTQYQGMMALDISFFNGENEEIEPYGNVQVSIKMDTGALPEDMNPESVSVQHLKEGTEGIAVQTVAGAAEGTDGNVEVREEEAIVSAEFEVDSFSTFTITWQGKFGSRTVNIKYVDQNGAEIEGSGAVNQTVDLGITVTLADYAFSIAGYKYQAAHLGSVSGAVVTKIKADWWLDYHFQYTSDGSNWTNLDNNATILLVYEGENPAPPSIEEIQKLSHDKYAQRRDDGTYDLTLTISGEVGSISNKALLDIVYVLDKSGSMKNSISASESTTCREAADNAINSLTNTLAGSDKLDVRFSLVTFSGENDSGKWNDASIVQDWTTTATDITGKSEPQADGGTNYQAGIREASTLLESKREGALTAVIFISDGNPTFYYDDKGYTAGKGGSYDEHALNAAKTALTSLYADYFFTVGVGPSGNYDRLKELKAAAANTQESNRKFYEGTGSNALNNAFDDIQSSITNLLCSDVKIEDTLSDNVQVVVDDTGAPENLIISVKDSSGKVVAEGAGSLRWDEITINASYNVSTKKITLDFPDDYELKRGYTYLVTAHIDATETAYCTYRDKSLVYTDRPDEGTGTHAPINGTIEDGFYSNNSAAVSYKYNGSKEEENYLRPVIRIAPGTLTVKKTISGLNGEQLKDLMGKLQFTVNLTWPNKDNAEEPYRESKVIRLSDMKPESSEDTYIYTYTIGGLSPETSYSVTEGDASVTGYDVATTYKNCSNTIAKGDSAEASIVNTYSPYKTLTIRKEVSENMGDKTKKFAFSYTIGTGETVKSGNFDLANGEEKVLYGIPVNTPVTVTETDYAEDGYLTFYKVGENGISKSGNSCSADITEDTLVIFTNSKKVTPPTGIFTNRIPYMLMLAAAVLGMMGFVLADFRKKALRKRDVN